ncbi:DUF4214 domain-containing protein [Paenibacillus humicola]|uniref:DUF4214 domain-containing protein n=1 Tax=Paenibacillus humicola TaxID=3110540 RepID=UPI00237BB9F0|nr:DUF4214 domain-containing protein [Paenibacillus humicola]
MRIAQLLHRAYQYNPDDFVKEMFKTALNREASAQDVQDHLQLMASGVTKNDVIIGILNSAEASMIMQGPLSLPPDAQETVIGKLQRLMALPPDHYVHHLYVEVLCRAPDQEGFEGHVMRLQQGESKIVLLTNFLQSDEWLELIQSDRNFIARKILHHFLSTL